MPEGFALEKTLDEIRSKIKPQYKWAFLACFITGVLTYGYTMTHHFLTYDSLWNLISKQDMITSGRQFLTYVCSISTDYDLPWLNGILAIFYMSITAVLVVEGLGIKSKYLAALSGMILVTFPSMASTFCYSFTIDGYMLGLMLAAAAFLLADKKKWGFLPGMVLLGISLGIYQAYVSFTILLCILKLLLYLLDGEKIKTVLIKSVKFVVMGLGAYVFYYLTLQFMMKAKGVTLSNYQGVDSIETFTISEIPMGIIAAYKQFFAFLSKQGNLATTDAMYFCVLALIGFGVGIYLWKFISQKEEKKAIRFLLIVLLLLVVPIGATLICVMEADVYFHSIMRLPWAVFFLFVLALVEKMPSVSKVAIQKIKSICTLAICVISVVLVSQFAITANVISFNMEERYEKTYGLCLRIVDRLEQTPGYTTGDKVAILGGGVNESYYPYTDFTSAYLKGYFGAEGVLCASDTAKFVTFCIHYLNVTMVEASIEEQMEIIETDTFKQMGKFPNSESIQKIGDIWVVKLNG